MITRWGHLLQCSFLMRKKHKAKERIQYEKCCDGNWWFWKKFKNSLILLLIVHKVFLTPSPTACLTGCTAGEGLPRTWRSPSLRSACGPTPAPRGRARVMTPSRLRWLGTRQWSCSSCAEGCVGFGTSCRTESACRHACCRPPTTSCASFFLHGDGIDG